MAREFSPRARKRIEAVLAAYPDPTAGLLGVLRIAEDEFGSLSPDAIRAVADTLKLSPGKVHGVVTFYTQFRRPEDGRHVIQICSTLSCALHGCEEILDRLRERLGIDVGETTPDGLFTLKKVECLASCGTAPVVQINDDYHEAVTVEGIDRIIDRLSAEQGHRDRDPT